ncbi:MAG: hypothetical protein ACOVQL_02905 [Limnohabitans sp.]|jgi:hypothetical protein
MEKVESVSTRGFQRWGVDRREADPQIFASKDKFVELGMHCKTIRTSQSAMGAIVRELHDAGIRLLDQASFRCAKKLIQVGYDSIETRTLDKYTCNLRSWLAYPPGKLPDCITISAPVPSYFNPGDEVDVMDAQLVWWHAVVLVVSKCMVTVYWVGFPPDSGSNPQQVNKSRNAIRVHGDDGSSKAGRNKAYDVVWIAANELCEVHPPTYKDVNVETVSSDSTSSDESGVDKSKDGRESGKKQGSVTPSPDAKPVQKPKTNDDKEEVEEKDEKGEEEEEEECRNSARRSTGGKSASRSTGKPGISKAGSGISKRSRLSARRSTGKLETRPSPSKSSNKEPIQAVPKKQGSEEAASASAPDAPRVRPEPVRKQAPMSASKVEEFFWATLPTVTETCIDNLELLAAGKTVHADVEREGLAMLASRCRSLHSLYANQEFQEFLHIAQEALESYEGKQSPYQRKFMVQELKKFGFVITPRMWSKLELLMLMVIILDPKLMYMGIRQKDRKDERDQNR